MAYPIIETIEDARTHFGGHSYIGPLIKACDEAKSPQDKETAMQALAQAIDGIFADADVSGLRISTPTHGRI